MNLRDRFTTKEIIARSAKIIAETSSGQTQQQKQSYLINHCGLTMEEYLEALNIASEGELLNSV